MSSPVLDRWALELQQFTIMFQHIQGKKNIADAIFWLRTLCIYQDNGNKDIPLSTEDVIKKHNRRGPPHRCHTENSELQCREAGLRCTDEGTTMQPILQKQGERGENKARPQLTAI